MIGIALIGVTSCGSKTNIRSVKATDAHDAYYVGDVFDDLNEISVIATTNNWDKITISSDEYSYTLYDFSNVVIDTSKPFEAVGNYTLAVSYKTYDIKAITISVLGSQQSKEKADYTIMIYMCGSNLESKYNLATANLREIVSIEYPNNVNVIIETGGANKWSSKYGIRASKLSRYHVENNNLVLDNILNDASMGESSTLQSFIEWGLNYYPANKVGFIFWNHGGGMDGVCYDERHDMDMLTNTEVHTAFADAFTSTNTTEKLEWVGYDACLMSVADVAEFNSQYFNYMVSSQELEPGDGWDYDGWLDNLAENPQIETETLLQEICDTYIEKCGGDASYNDGQLSVLDLSNANSFLSAWESMASSLTTYINSQHDWYNFTSEIITECHAFGYDEISDTYCDVFDVQDFIDAMGNSKNYGTIDVSSIETALNDLVIYNSCGPAIQGVCGLSFFCGIDGYVYQNSYTSSNTNFTNWHSLNSSYGNFF